MNTNKKQFWVIVPTIIALVFTLTACGQTGNEPAETSTPSAPVETTTPTETPAETPTGGPIEVLQGEFITKKEDGKFILPTGEKVECPETSKGVFYIEDGTWTCDTGGEW